MHHIVALYRINIQLFGSCHFVKFSIKKIGELIHWKLFTNIEIWGASSRYINISKLKIWGCLFLAGTVERCYGLFRVEFYLYLGISILIWTWFDYKYLHSRGLVAQWITRLSGVQEDPRSNPTMGKNFSFWNSRFFRVPHNATMQLQMKSTVAYT